MEGYAINRWVARHPVAHAWCIDLEGFVVDTTWDEGMDYFGVPFRMQYVRRIALATAMVVTYPAPFRARTFLRDAKKLSPPAALRDVDPG